MSYNYVFIEPNNYQNNQNQILITNIEPINNPVFNPQVFYMNNPLGPAYNNAILFQDENINQNKPLDLKNSNSLDKLSIKKKSRNQINKTESIYKTKTLNTTNRMKKIMSNLESSGTLIVSNKTKRYNKVILKNGKKIKNIDINDDCEDTMKDEDSVTSFKMKNKLKSDNNLKKTTQNNLNLNNKLISNDKQNSNFEAKPKQSIPTINNNKKPLNPVVPNLNSKKIEVQPKQTIKRINNNNSSESLKEDKSVNSLLSDKYDKISSNKGKSKSNDQKSHTTKKEDDSKSRKTSGSTHSKAPFQRLTISDFPLIPNGTNIFGVPSYNTNSNNSNSSYNTQNSVAESYLSSHLGEYLDKEFNSINNLQMNEPLENNKIGKGFKYCDEFTKAGRDPEGKTKIDQDTPLISLNVGGMQGFNLFGVLDGHGPHGHFVSQFCKEYFIKNMTNYVVTLRNTKQITNAEMLYNELKSNGYSFLIQLYTQADVELTKQDAFDYSLSGTTCNIVFQFNNHLVCVSVGDSRGILIYDKGNLTNQGILALSTDHKPDLPGEYQRIQACGGMVDTMKDIYGNSIGPSRVFKIGSGYPGLAMSRSLGDLHAKECGVIPTPQIIEYDINNSTKFMVICSDGVWEFIQNEQVRDLGNVFYAQNNVTGFCKELVNYAVSTWEQFDVIRDDITVVSVFF